MKHILRSCALLGLLTACEGGELQNTLGLNRQAPDEFTVVSRPPLTVPPEFNLRPPEPGAPPLGITPQTQARELLTGTKPGVSTAGSGQATGLLKQAGADIADPEIRAKLGQDERTPPDTSTAKSLMEKLIPAKDREPVVDPKGESERLRENKDSGKPINEGDVPEEKTKTDSLIDRIF